MPIRQQRLFLELQRYDIEIVYKPGKEMFLADTLSRAFSNENNEDLLEELSVNEVHPLSYCGNLGTLPVLMLVLALTGSYS